MIKATHFVLDLETMGNRPGAAIVAIGCARVDHLELTGRFYRRVSLESSLQAGLTCDPSTIEWWLGQSDAARAEIIAPGAMLLGSALQDLVAFMGCKLNGPPDRNALVWGNGSSFDNVIIGNAFDACGIKRPWMFWNDRDLRTLLALYPAAKTTPFEGTKHNALDDAVHEAHQLILALREHQESAKGFVPATLEATTNSPNLRAALAEVTECLQLALTGGQVPAARAGRALVNASELLGIKQEGFV